MTDFPEEIGRTTCRLLDTLGQAPLLCFNDKGTVGLIATAVIFAVVVVVAWRRFL